MQIISVSVYVQVSRIFFNNNKIHSCFYLLSFRDFYFIYFFLIIKFILIAFIIIDKKSKKNRQSFNAIKELIDILSDLLFSSFILGN